MREHLVPKMLIGETLGRNKQNIRVIPFQAGLNVFPLFLVVRVDGQSTNTHSFRSRYLIAHQ